MSETPTLKGRERRHKSANLANRGKILSNSCACNWVAVGQSQGKKRDAAASIQIAGSTLKVSAPRLCRPVTPRDNIHPPLIALLTTDVARRSTQHCIADWLRGREQERSQVHVTSNLGIGRETLLVWHGLKFIICRASRLSWQLIAAVRLSAAEDTHTRSRGNSLLHSHSRLTTQRSASGSI